MSPDIEWQIGEDAEQETIAQTSNAPRARRGRWAVIIAIGLGASLGLLYRSIPEPSSKPIGPTPAPAVVQEPLSPLPAPETLEMALQRDAFYLATAPAGVNRIVTFDPALSSMSQTYADWYAALQNTPRSWERKESQLPVTVYETGTLPGGVVWAEVGQFRNNDFFRHTRFYRWQNGHWIWTLPDPSFWSGATAKVSTSDASTIGPVTIVHPIEDAPMIGAVFDRFTRAYLNLCESLKCPPPAHPASLWAPGLTLAITIQPTLTRPEVQESGGRLVIGLPSPRVVGYYEDASTPGDPYASMAYAILAEPVVRLASGDYSRWETERGGELFLQAIAVWIRARVQAEIHPLELFYPAAFMPPASARMPDGRIVSKRETYTNLLHHGPMLPLTSLWDWPSARQGFRLMEYAVVNETEAVVIFVEDQYGTDAVVRFLNALGQAHSLEEAIEKALPTSFGEFNREWLRWVGEK